MERNAKIFILEILLVLVAFLGVNALLLSVPVAADHLLSIVVTQLGAPLFIVSFPAIAWRGKVILLLLGLLPLGFFSFATYSHFKADQGRPILLFIALLWWNTLGVLLVLLFEASIPGYANVAAG